MVLLDPSAPVRFGISVVCGPYVGILLGEGKRTVSILTSRDLVDVPADTPMRPVIQHELAQHVVNVLCQDNPNESTSPVWAEAWSDRELLIAELASSFAKSERVVRAALRRKDPTLHAPEAIWPLAGYEYMGAFRVERGLIIADRCYVNRDHLLLSSRTPALAGSWHAYIRSDPHFNARNVAMLAVHEDHFDMAKHPGVELGLVGVDAGCAVIVDQRVLDDAALVHALTQTSDWEEGLINDVGFFAYTYDGDGVYRSRAIEKTGVVVAVRANLTRNDDYDYHTPPPPKEYTSSLEGALATAGPAKPYSIYETFVQGDRLAHKKFGEGLVAYVVDAGKIDVSFLEGTKTLVHGQKK
jgi:hypothetical protein